MRTLLLMGIAVAIGVVSLRFLPDDRPPLTVAACVRDFGAGFVSEMPPDLERHMPARKVDAAARVVCTELTKKKYKSALADDDSTSTFVRLIREQPKLYTPLCALVVNADLAANARLYRFATSAERSRYRREHCRLAPRYLKEEPAGAKPAHMAVDHPGVYVPLCASLVQHSVGPPAVSSLSPKQLRTIARRSCREAVRKGALRSGANGLADAEVDDDRFWAIVDRISGEVAPASASTTERIES